MQWKLHIFVIAIMTTVLSLGYFLLRPDPKHIVVTQVIDPIHITMVEASWGLNCNRYIEQQLKKSAFGSSALAGDAASDSKESPALAMIKQNNVLTILQTLCDKKTQCQLTARNDILGNPYTDCSKELTVAWRCFSYDKLHEKTINENNSFTLSCASDTSSDTAK